MVSPSEHPNLLVQCLLHPGENLVRMLLEQSQVQLLIQRESLLALLQDLDAVLLMSQPHNLKLGIRQESRLESPVAVLEILTSALGFRRL